MSIRVRCTGCGKKVSVDDAFAGGACRCPYCKEIVLVGGSPPEESGSRPYAPVDRPQAPDDVRPAAPGASPARSAHVPMANPVRVQGLLTFVLIGLIAVMAAVAVWLGVALSGPAKTDANLAGGASRGGPPTPPTRPSPGPLPVPGPRTRPGPGPIPAPHPMPVPPAGEGASAAGIPIASPVVYVMDTGAGMKFVHDYARYIVRASAVSLGPDGNFNVALATAKGVRFLGEGYRAGGQAVGAALKEFLEDSAAGSAELDKALEAALAKGPRTIVLVCRGGMARAGELARTAKAARVTIVAVGLDSDAAAAETLRKLAEPTGGRCRTFTASELEAWVERQPPLD